MLKRKHIGKPAYNFPIFIFVPTAIFYICLYGSGADLTWAQDKDNGWLFKEPKSVRQVW